MSDSATPRGSRLFDIEQTARELGISKEAVRKRILRGRLPATKQSGQWWVHWDEFLEAVSPDTLEPPAPGTPVTVRFRRVDMDAESGGQDTSQPVHSTVSQTGLQPYTEDAIASLRDHLVLPILEELRDQVSEKDQRIEQQAEELGRLRERLRQLEEGQERDTRHDTPDQPPDMVDTVEDHDEPEPVSEPTWLRWLRRLT